MFNIFMCNNLTLMSIYYSIKRDNWEASLVTLSASYKIYGVTDRENSLDYELIGKNNVSGIIYNKPKPATPLKTFFLPVKENVTSETGDETQRIIIGTPNCDVEALAILDEIYLDESFEDIFYRRKRENTIIISSDCFEIQEHCHCTSYGINPFCFCSCLCYPGCTKTSSAYCSGIDGYGSAESLNDIKIKEIHPGYSCLGTGC